MALDRPRLAALTFLLVVGAGLAGVGAWAWRSMTAAQNVAFGENSSGYRAPADLPSALPAVSLAGVRAAVVAHAASEGQRRPGALRAEAERWRGWLAGAGARMVAPADADVLVVPHAVCLGAELRAGIERHLRAGKGIVSVGLLGARNASCHPLPDTLLFALLGGGRPNAAPLRSRGGESHYAVVLGETALGAGIPPGSRLEIRSADQTVFRGPERSVFYTDYERTPVRHRDREWFDGAVARARVGPGRVAAFGFGMTEVVPGWSEDIARRLAANAVAWAAGRPVVQVATWPEGKRAAAVVAQDVEADFGNARAAADVLDEAGIPATYFLLGDLARKNPWTTRRLVRGGEIGTHTDDHKALDRLTPQALDASLGLAKSEAEKLSGRPVRGLRPPEERFDLETLRAWARVGGDYVFAANNTRSASPEMVPLGRDTLVLLARVVGDDFEVLERAAIRDRGAMTRTMLREVDEVMAYRGIYMFSYHSQMFARDDLLPVLRSLAGALRATPGVWVAQAGDVATWWRARAAVRHEVSTDGRTVLVTNTGRTPFRQGVLLVDLPDGAQKRMALPELPSGGSVRLQVPAR